MILILALLAMPLLSAGGAALARGRAAMEAAYLAGAAGTFAAAVLLARGVLAHGAAASGHGFFYVDALSALVAGLTALVALAMAPYAIGYFRAGAAPEPTASARRYYVLSPVFVAGMMLIAVSNNLGVLWIAVELTVLASILLVNFHGRAASLEAAWKYAIVGGVGLAMALLGTVLTYYAAYHGGSGGARGLDWSVLVQRAAGFDPQAMRLGFILVLLGYGTKAGLAPMHTWKPDAYSEAPVPVAALLATALVNCALYAIARFYVLAAACLGPGFVSHLLILFGLLSVAIAAPFILIQRSFRRLLAYSSIDQAGIMTLALGFGGPLGALGMLLQMTFHSATKPLLFCCAGNTQQRMGSDRLRAGRGGVLAALPVSAPLFLLGALAVTGTPPFSMFQSEFLIMRAGIASGRTAAVAGFLALAVAIFCGFLHHITHLVFAPARGGDGAEAGAGAGEGSRWKTWPAIGLAALAVGLGLWLPGPLYALVSGAARVLGGRP